MYWKINRDIVSQYILFMARIIVEDLTTVEFSLLVGQAVEAALSKKGEQAQEDRVLTREETAKLLAVDLSTLRSYVNKGKILSHRIGGRVFFKHSDIMKALVEFKPAKS